jgi:hypothetical protein
MIVMSVTDPANLNSSGSQDVARQQQDTGENDENEAMGWSIENNH